MPRAPLVWLSLALAIGGCAAAMPGYTPDSPKTQKMKALAPKGGGFDKDGAYSLTEQEQKLDCKHITGGITIKIIQMREAQERAKPSLAATTIQQGLRPLKGGTTYATSLDEDQRRDRARLETLNKQLAEKGCRTFDLDAELAPGNTKTPQPVGEAKKG